MIEKRLILPDRIQLVCSPNFMAVKNDENHFKTGYLKAKENNWIITRPRNKKGEQRPTVNIPEELYKRDYPYISHLAISLKKPYSVSMEFNFIRFIKGYCRNTNPLLFNSYYNDKIRVHEDNYINNKIYPINESGLYDVMIKDVSYLSQTISEQYAKELYGTVAFEYNLLSIKQIEFNIDNTVGENQSLELFNKFIIYLHSDEGDFWRKTTLKEIAYKEIQPKESEFEDLNPLEINEKLRSHYLFFEILKGMKYKLYRKTTDDIRAELIFESSYIKNHYRSQQFNAIYDLLYDKASSFLNKTNLIDILENLKEKPSYTKGCEQRMINTYEFLGKLNDGIGLQQVYDAIYFGDPVVTQEGIQALRNNKNLRNDFVQRLSSSGQRIYIFSPEEARKKQEEREREKRFLNKMDARQIYSIK
jgi:hypothetical protein